MLLAGSDKELKQIQTPSKSTKLYLKHPKKHPMATQSPNKKQHKTNVFVDDLFGRTLAAPGPSGGGARTSGAREPKQRAHGMVIGAGGEGEEELEKQKALTYVLIL